jgi:peptidoglycan/xylan/chitin deacetylase (PgdA/CDA1 family)
MSAETNDEATPDFESDDEAGSEAAEHDHDHADHDHDEEDEAQAEVDLARMEQALAALDDETFRAALAAMSEKSRLEVASQLQLPRATMRLGDALVPLVRRKLQTAGPEHQLQVLFALAQHVNDQTVEALGPRSEEPTRDDLLEVLPDVIEKHGVTLVTLMLAGYAASDALARPVMRELLETDDRFVIGEPVEVEAKPELASVAPKIDKAELEAKREQRRTAKEAKRAAELREREARATADAKRRQAVHEAKRKTR